MLHLCHRVVTVITFLWLGSSPLLFGQESAWLDPAGSKGPLVIAGGGELPPEILERFVKLGGGEKALLVVIPTASEQADKQVSRDEERAKLLEPWGKLGV